MTIIAKIKNNDESLNFIIKEFNKIEKPNKKILFDLANFYKNSKKYDEAIRYYTKIIDTLEKDEKIKSDLLYRRGGSYERAGKYEMADKDLLHSLKINPDDAYVLNYLAYSWLERNYQIDKAIEIFNEVGKVYIPCLIANANAYENGDEIWETSIDGEIWKQKTFPYQVKCLNWIKDEFNMLSPDDKEITLNLIGGSGCEKILD